MIPDGARPTPLAVPGAGVHAADKRMQIIRKYARRDHRGHVTFCQPKPGERKSGKTTSAGKPIYASVEVASRAAVELVTAGARRMEAYVCHRSKTGHAHLRTVR